MRNITTRGLPQFLTILIGIGLAGGCTAERAVEDAAVRPGTIVIGASADPNSLFPPLALNVEARQATELMYEYLADVGVGMNTVGDAGFVRQIASGWTWTTDSMSITFQIDPRARWHDGAPVTAADVAFSFMLYSDPEIGSTLTTPLAMVDSVSAPDARTAVFWFGRRGPRQFYTAAAMMLILPRHLLGQLSADSLREGAASRDPVGSGPYRYSSWEKGSQFEITAVEDHYRAPPLNDRIVWSIAPDYKTGVLRLLAGEVDVFANVRQESLEELSESDKFRTVMLPGMDYVFMQLNHANPILASREMRRALTMALDRRAMVQSLLGPLGAVSLGPAVRAFPTTDTALAQIPFDRPRAESILDSMGWRRAGADAIRSRDGNPLRIEILVPVSSQSRMRIAVLIQEQLRAAGVDAVIEQMDFAAFSARQAARDFDAALASWTLGSSPEAVRATWTSKAAEEGGLNYGGYRNPSFDRLVDSALAAENLADSRRLFRRANQIIIDDAAAVWLYEPRSVLAIHTRLSTAPMRPNAWWLGLPAWKVKNR
jgi:peptide/nickel transport system substrate-binding protein